MTFDDWVRVIDQAAEAEAASVQFVGGEPTLYPRLPDLINHALRKRLSVEVFSNLYRVTAALAIPSLAWRR